MDTPRPATATADSKSREQEALFRTKLAELAIEVSDDLILAHTDLQFDVACVVGGRPRFRLTGGRFTRTYTCRQGVTGFNFDVILKKIETIYGTEMEQARYRRESDDAREQAKLDAAKINKSLGLKDHHFPRVIANKGDVPLIISSPHGLTRVQAEAALKAIYDNAPSDDPSMH
jgi:hypothetical protein